MTRVLWFAFKFLPLQYLRQRGRNFGPHCRVVICFQILTFAVSATAHARMSSRASTLWFAFKFLPLQYLRQPERQNRRAGAGCDLLSNSYLCSICDSLRILQDSLWVVVICFQILTFAVSATAFFSARSVSTLLWFAFKFLPLQYLRQPRAPGSPSSRSCDLLSNSYLCSICDSNRSANTGYFAVVICFQILTFAVSATASTLPRFCPFRLWFAFKFLPLQYLRQLSLPF